MFKLNGERFELIQDFEDYAIGENGTVLSKKKGTWNKMSPYSATTSKYLCISLTKKGVHYKKLVHRLVGYAFVSGYFDGAIINHKDSNIFNNNYRNLEWTTQKENIHQSYKHSGISALRNYLYYRILYRNNPISPWLKGGPELKRYILDNDIPVSFSSLYKYKKTHDYTIEVKDKNNF